VTKKEANLAKKDNFLGSVLNISIPSCIFMDRRLSVLEILVEYLIESKKMKYSEIARLLNRNDRTIWTVYDRSKKKRLNGK